MRVLAKRLRIFTVEHIQAPTVNKDNLLLTVLRAFRIAIRYMHNAFVFTINV